MLRLTPIALVALLLQACDFNPNAADDCSRVSTLHDYHDHRDDLSD